MNHPGKNVKEVWFAGDGSNVGGQEDCNNGLTQIALNGMINEAITPTDRRQRQTYGTFYGGG